MERKCKNKSCQRILPNGYKYDYCERCRNRRSDKIKNARNCVGGLGAIALSVLTILKTKKH